MTTLSQIPAPAFALAITLLALGPVAADEVPATVTGVVTVNGQPLARGTIVFHLDDDEFVGSRIKGGNYKVTRVPTGAWRATIRSDEIPAKPASEDTGGFRVTVKQGRNTLDFDVRKK